MEYGQTDEHTDERQSTSMIMAVSVSKHSY